MAAELSDILIRQARREDLPALVAMFAADALGGHGDTTDPEAFADYVRAFVAIEASPDQTLYVAERRGEVVGTFQTMVTTSLTGRGSSAMIIEAVQTRADMRGQGVGALMIEFAIAEAKGRGIGRVALTSNAVRKDAHRFYERLGFKPSHLGFKMALK
ncbi:GNAT family N-acetyltransferase [Rhizobium leguminosarum]|uniref:GNAT family N-acetyltransferase n=1 Tax=Rhizobium leguminosarum TaxID=384 RepID=UPI00103CB294|nr:GNAT family N-acetyltransferase [Rhizobium leguminosarum]MBY5798485.1 GNAT family N-acetyltransferase [Rhizobium leguminosarum]NKK65708.1 GNAT family N-acetyltransferase [Rhizobium leguminosarum bv. viciae]NKL06068.1 GNAT family N-acetyltransferase [Rhizobium leguminosarum bv. viciae]NKL83429.1 GNAT family N-acetyltransferase [Rhizobium leguminosarum bv. viciae]NKL92362.1 GNAT family N-acetyltransferase [Rhizobium leguminosarum bv. viciae]